MPAWNFIASLSARLSRWLRWIGPFGRLDELPDDDQQRVLDEHWRNG